MKLQILLAASLLLVAAAVFAAPDATELMARSERTVKLAGARIELSFELNAASGSQRLRKLSSLVRTDPKTGNTSRLARFEFPADARGLATLLIEHHGRDDELWVYVPAVKKLRRLVADNQRDSFMGTVLSHGDVLGYKAADWTHEIAGEAEFEGHACWRVISKPANEAVRKASGYSQRESWIDRQTAFNWRMDTWDESVKPLKTITNRDVRPIAQQPGAFIAYQIEAKDLQEGTSSRMTVDRFEYVPGMKAEEFSPALLEDEP